MLDCEWFLLNFIFHLRHIRSVQLLIGPMFLSPGFGRSLRLRQNAIRSVAFLSLLLQVCPFASRALPKRLILGLDGVAYRDLKALQAGVLCTNMWGKPFRRQAFSLEEGYFPVSRMVSTFPSTSDVAWTDIFGDRPLPGYQRTYFSAAANSQIVINGITSTMEHESQMSWQMENNMFRTMGYVVSGPHLCVRNSRNHQKLLGRHEQRRQFLRLHSRVGRRPAPGSQLLRPALLARSTTSGDACSL